MNVMQQLVSGGNKVYVKIGNPLTYEKWVAGYKAGRTFVTNGPMVFLEVDGKQPGEEIHIDSPRSLNIRVRAQSPVVPISVVELIVNGEVAASAKPTRAGWSVELHHTLRLDRSSWIAARAWGNPHRLVLNGINDSRAFAHTSPVYCYLGHQRIAFPEDARILVAWIDRLLLDVAASPRFSTEAKRHEVIALFRKARKFYQDIIPN
ncbi:MAG: CehA/McbA family metallohydrolase [Bryobacteraceae bacterium]